MTKGAFAGALAATLAASACNSVGTCPTADSISPGGSCAGESLECAYTLQSPSSACDGTAIDGGIATSCVCTKGTWTCPQPVTCPASSTGDAAGGDDGGGQGEAGEDAGNAG